MKIYRISQMSTEEFYSGTEEEDPMLSKIIDEKQWSYFAAGPGYWTLGYYSIDADTPLEEFEVRYKKALLGQEETFEKAMQLALDHYQGYADVTEEKAVTPYEIIEKKFGYTGNPQSAGYIMADGQMVNLNRPHIDHRAVTVDGTTKSMQQFMAEGNIRMSFSHGYLFLDIKKKPTTAQLKTIYKICEQVTDGASINLDNGIGEFNERRETHDETDTFLSKQFKHADPDSVQEFINSYYSGKKKYTSPMEKYMNVKIWKLAGKSLSVGNVGSVNNDNDRNRLYVVSDWLSRNDPEYVQEATFNNDHIDLSTGRDFLKESKSYDMVVLQHVYNPTDLERKREGYFSVSPHHTSENWVKRLQSTNADYIFVWGSYSEVGSWWLGNIPGYDIADHNDYQTVYRKQGLPQIKVEEPKRIDWDNIDVSWLEKTD